MRSLIHRSLAHQKKRVPVREVITWRERLLAAIAAFVVFNLSTFLVIVFSVRGLRRFPNVVFLTPSAFVIVLSIVPAVVGFFAGFDKLVQIFGHTFYTNPEPERDARVTVFIWALLTLMALFTYCLT